MAGISDVWQTVQNIQQSIASIARQLNSGLTFTATLTSYTVAALPVSGSPGQTVWASNGRKPAEGAGSGTGVPVFWNPATTQWFSYLSGAAVTS